MIDNIANIYHLSFTIHHYYPHSPLTIYHFCYSTAEASLKVHAHRHGLFPGVTTGGAMLKTPFLNVLRTGTEDPTSVTETGFFTHAT